MAGKLDTQGWIDATRNGRNYAFFLRDGIYGYAATANTNAHRSAALTQSKRRAPWLGQSWERRKTGWTKLVPKGQHCPATNRREV